MPSDRELGLTIDRKSLLEKFFSTGIEDYISAADRSGYFSVGNFDKVIIVGLLNNVVSTFVTDIESERRIYRLVLDIDPNHAVNWYNLGNRLDGEEAVECYRKSLAINPNNAEAWYNLGRKLEGHETIECYRKTLKLDPTYWMAAYSMAYKMAGDKATRYRKDDIDFILNWQGNIPDEYDGETQWQEWFDKNRQIIRNRYPKPN